MNRMLLKLLGFIVFPLFLSLPARAQGLPDLTVLSVGSPATAGTAQTVMLTNVLANAGVGTAGNWQYRIYQSTNSTITTNATVLTTQSGYVDFPAQSIMTNYDTVTIPAGTPTGTNYFGIIIDFDNMVMESNEANNAKSSSSVIIRIGPDLTAPSVTGPSSAGTAQTVALTNILANAGIGTAGNWQYRVYLSTNATITTNNTVLTTQSGYVDFPAQSSMTNYDTVTIPPDTTPGIYYFGVIIDFDNKVSESNENNNTRSSAPVTIGIGPDLTVTSIGYPSIAGTDQTLILTNVLANIGVGSALSWKYRVYLSTNATTAATNGTILTTQGNFDIAAQTAITNYAAVAIPDTLATGTYYFAIMIDVEKNVTESVETNNIRIAGPVTIGIGPDLTVLAVTAPNCTGPGLDIGLTSRLANSGIGSAGNWHYRVYLSTNSSITTNATVLTTRGDVNFPAQSFITNADTVTIPQGTAPGTYYLGVIIDYNNGVIEANEGNNALGSLPMAVGPIIIAVAYRTNTVSIDIAGLAVSDGYSLQYIAALTGTNAWTTGTLFTAQGLTTNCLDSVSPSIPSRFYRIGHQ